MFRYRSGTITAPQNGYIIPAAGYSVVVYDVGAVVSAASSGGTVTVHAGHGFVATDRMMRVRTNVTTSEQSFRKLSAVAATTLTLDTSGGGAAPVTLGVANLDRLVNLGGDTGATSPAYDGSTVSVYSDPGLVSAITNSIVSVDNNGNYEYWTKADRVWELVRDGSGLPIDVLQAAPLPLGTVDLVETFTSGDATPSVANGRLFKTAGTTAITDFDDGVVGQEIVILAESDSITITYDPAIIWLNLGVDYVMEVGSTLTLRMFTDGIWHEVARSDNVA